ncbi:magnesium and cobalt transport protein CorA [Brevibacillus laterosporus]|nr:magnesium and cobalt transport protein CorA [Brevibacillus laterosporus]PPA86075.1 magnesium and cobalt transport protein CorA [Brevibacillus laterosporus]
MNEVENVSERTPKERLYWLIELLQQNEIELPKFCDEFSYTYNIDLDYDELTELESEMFRNLADVTSRFSPYEEDHKLDPKAFYKVEDVREAVSIVVKKSSLTP